MAKKITLFLGKRGCVTNGDVIKAVFPNIIVEYGYGLAIGVDFGVGGERDLSRDWWNAPYKAGDTDGNS